MWLLACHPAPDSTSPSKEQEEQVESSLLDSGWPEVEDWSAGLSLVVNGELQADGALFVVETAPAGLDEGLLYSVVLSNRSSSALNLDSSPENWLSGEGWSLQGELPTTLASEASASFFLSFNPIFVEQAGAIDATLGVPGQALTVQLRAQVPAPLRTVVVGDGGWSATSDDYGRSWTAGPTPTTVSSQARTITWGEGRFFRGDVGGFDWTSPGVYASSTDGQQWVEATSAEDFWPSECAWGLDIFSCLRGGVFSWSESGGAVIHEPTDYSDLVNALVFVEDHFVGVGRAGRRLWSSDGKNWEGSNNLPEGDEYSGLVSGDGILVAAGGTRLDNLRLSTSLDGGYTWTERAWGASQYAGMQSVAYTNGLFLAQAQSNTDPLMWRSTDGLSWEEVPGMDRWESYYLLGATNGAFLGIRGDELYRSLDGESWELVLSPPADVSIRAMAVEGRP